MVFGLVGCVCRRRAWNGCDGWQCRKEYQGRMGCQRRSRYEDGLYIPLGGFSWRVVAMAFLLAGDAGYHCDTGSDLALYCKESC
jgi:hypothetical protein